MSNKTETELTPPALGQTGLLYLNLWDKAEAEGDAIYCHVLKRLIERLSDEEQEAACELRDAQAEGRN